MLKGHAASAKSGENVNKYIEVLCKILCNTCPHDFSKGVLQLQIRITKFQSCKSVSAMLPYLIQTSAVISYHYQHDSNLFRHIPIGLPLFRYLFFSMCSGVLIYFVQWLPELLSQQLFSGLLEVLVNTIQK